MCFFLFFFLFFFSHTTHTSEVFKDFWFLYLLANVQTKSFLQNDTAIVCENLRDQWSEIQWVQQIVTWASLSCSRYIYKRSSIQWILVLWSWVCDSEFWFPVPRWWRRSAESIDTSSTLSVNYITMVQSCKQPGYIPQVNNTCICPACRFTKKALEIYGPRKRKRKVLLYVLRFASHMLKESDLFKLWKVKFTKIDPFLKESYKR